MCSKANCFLFSYKVSLKCQDSQRKRIRAALRKAKLSMVMQARFPQLHRVRSVPTVTICLEVLETFAIAHMAASCCRKRVLPFPKYCLKLLAFSIDLPPPPTTSLTVLFKNITGKLHREFVRQISGRHQRTQMSMCALSSHA